MPDSRVPIIRDWVHALTCEFPLSIAEAYDALISVGYDLSKARRMIADAQECAIPITELLALYQPREEVTDGR